MKAYLLLCFFLLFYSINSSTKNTYQSPCKQQKNTCLASCAKLNKNLSTYYSYCQWKCERRYTDCLFVEGQRRKFGSHSK